MTVNWAVSTIGRSIGYTRAVRYVLVVLSVLAVSPQVAIGQGQVVDLTLERMVELGLRDSYRVRLLEMNVERTRFNLRAQQAGLKSRVTMNITAPQFQALSEYEYDSEVGHNILVHQNTRRWEANLSVTQPVILFGYPTNGELSLNSRIYRYTQYDEERDIRYYNRYFIGYEQPLFQPNRMKNDLEGAQLDLEDAELDYIGDVVGLVWSYTNEYYRLFNAAYDRVIAEELVHHLEDAAAVASQVAAADQTRVIESDQIQVELANAREQLQQSISSFRLQAANLKQDLQLNPADSVVLNPVLNVEPVQVDIAHAVELASTLTPRIRQLEITRRENEISLDQTSGFNAFRVNLNLTYGREVQDPRFRDLFQEPRNSYTVNVSAFIPIWDWGQRKYRIEASRINLQRTNLQLEQAYLSIQTEVESEIRNLEEYQQRALNMQTNMQFAHDITNSTLERYRSGEVALVDLLQTIDREHGTATNFLAAFLGYRRALLSLQRLTFYDFESDMTVMDRFGIGTPANNNDSN